MRKLCAVVWSLALLARPDVVAASVPATLWLIPPVDGPIVERFVEPLHRWGPGHRGLDIAASSGTAVRAATDGYVTFSGRIPDGEAVTLSHEGGYETTYSVLGSRVVTTGQRVTEGSILGTVARPHEGAAPGLHFGVKLHEAYVDPQPLLARLDTAGAIHLAPLMWQPPAEMGESFASAFRDAGTAVRDCVQPHPLGDNPPSPNGNIAIAVAGIGSSTEGGTIYERGPEQLGYPIVYPFSYSGIDRGDGHVPYGPDATFGDINVAAGKLRALLAYIGRRHPGKHVDLIAHSQGGIVARTLLARAARSSDLDVPPVDHLVTFATPHQGAPMAGKLEELEDGPIGRVFLRLARRASIALGAPDPTSQAVHQLAPGSDLLETLNGETLLYGTRALTLAIPNDPVVPAHTALLEGAVTDVVPPEGVFGHEAIVGSDAALASAYQFLRGGPDPCRDGWDRWGSRAGRAIGWIESRLSDLPEALIRRGF